MVTYEMLLYFKFITSRNKFFTSILFFIVHSFVRLTPVAIWFGGKTFFQTTASQTNDSIAYTYTQTFNSLSVTLSSRQTTLIQLESEIFHFSFDKSQSRRQDSKRTASTQSPEQFILYRFVDIKTVREINFFLYLKCKSTNHRDIAHVAPEM